MRMLEASLAQPAERAAVNRKVTGSIPVGSVFSAHAFCVMSVNTLLEMADSNASDYKELIQDIEAFMAMQDPHQTHSHAQPQGFEIPSELIDSLAALYAQSQMTVGYTDMHETVSPPTTSFSDPQTEDAYKVCPNYVELGYCPDIATCIMSHDELRPASNTTSEYVDQTYQGTQEVADDHDVPALSLGHIDPRTIRLYKTRYCSFGPDCPYRLKGRCIYAHSKDEMRSRPPPPSGYPRLPQNFGGSPPLSARALPPRRRMSSFGFGSLDSADSESQLYGNMNSPPGMSPTLK